MAVLAGLRLADGRKERLLGNLGGHEGPDVRARIDIALRAEALISENGGVARNAHLGTEFACRRQRGSGAQAAVDDHRADLFEHLDLEGGLLDPSDDHRKLSCCTLRHSDPDGWKVRPAVRTLTCGTILVSNQWVRVDPQHVLVMVPGTCFVARRGGTTGVQGLSKGPSRRRRNADRTALRRRAQAPRTSLSQGSSAGGPVRRSSASSAVAGGG